MITDDRAFFPRQGHAYDPARLSVVTAPEVEPWLVTDSEVLQHLRLDSEDDAAYVTLLLNSARKYLERTTGQALITQTLRATYDRTPVGTTLDLPRAPLISITAVSYIDSSGSAQTFSSAAYQALNTGIGSCFGRLALKPDHDWPDLGDYQSAFSVTFTAGYGSAATAIPEDLRLALLWLTAWWYEERQPVNVGNIVNSLPAHLEALIDQHRVSAIA